MSISALPTPPEPTDTTAVFNSRAFALLSALVTFVTEANVLQADVTVKSATATDKAASTAADRVQTGLDRIQTGLDRVQTTLDAASSIVSANNAETSRLGADKRYLGAKASAPTLDNQGAALQAGAVYYDTVLLKVRTWTGSVWTEGISAVAGVSSVNGNTGEVADIVDLTSAQTLTNKTFSASTNNIEASALRTGTATVSLSAAAAPTAGQVLMATGPSAAGWGTPVVSVIGDVITTTQALASPTWLPCDNATYLQSSYPALFSAIGLISDEPSAASSVFPLVYDYAGLAFGNGIVVAGYEYGSAVSTNGGGSWVGYTTTNLYSCMMCFGGGLFLSLVNFSNATAYISSNGQTWTAVTLPSSRSWSKAAYGNGVFLIMASDGTTATSSNGVTWVARTGPGNLEFTFGNGLFVTAPNGSTYFTSTDAITWTARALSFSATYIGYVGGLFIAQASKVLFVSADGISWRRIVANSDLGKVAGVRGLFFSSGLVANTILVSRNLETWVARGYPSAYSRHPISGPDSVVFRPSGITDQYGGVVFYYSYNKATQFATPRIESQFPLKTFIKAI